MEGGQQQDRLIHSLLSSTPSSYEAQNPNTHLGQRRKQGHDFRYRAIYKNKLINIKSYDYTGMRVSNTRMKGTIETTLRTASLLAYSALKCRIEKLVFPCSNKAVAAWKDMGGKRKNASTTRRQPHTCRMTSSANSNINMIQTCIKLENIIYMYAYRIHILIYIYIYIYICVLNIKFYLYIHTI